MSAVRNTLPLRKPLSVFRHYLQKERAGLQISPLSNNKKITGCSCNALKHDTRQLSLLSKAETVWEKKNETILYSIKQNHHFVKEHFPRRFCFCFVLF